MSEKYDRVLRFCDKEVDRIHKLFRKQKSNPPLPRYFPPLAGKKNTDILPCILLCNNAIGRVKWVRCLQMHLLDLVNSISGHPVLHRLPASAELTEKYNNVNAALLAFEAEVVKTWTSQTVRSLSTRF
jgi:dynein heavy chain, axonemal